MSLVVFVRPVELNGKMLVRVPVADDDCSVIDVGVVLGAQLIPWHLIARVDFEEAA